MGSRAVVRRGIMVNDRELVNARTAEVGVAARDVLGLLHRRQQLKPLLWAALAEKVAITAARTAGLTIPDAELQQAADRFRYRHGLSTAEDTRRRLAGQFLTVEDWEAGLER